MLAPVRGRLPASTPTYVPRFWLLGLGTGLPCSPGAAGCWGLCWPRALGGCVWIAPRVEGCGGSGHAGWVWIVTAPRMSSGNVRVSQGTVWAEMVLSFYQLSEDSAEVHRGLCGPDPD